MISLDKGLKKSSGTSNFSLLWPINLWGESASIGLISAIGILRLAMIILLPFFHTNEEYFELVKRVSPSIIAVTEGDKQIENKKNQAKKIGAEVKEVITNLKNFSTRNIIKIVLPFLIILFIFSLFSFDYSLISSYIFLIM